MTDVPDPPPPPPPIQSPPIPPPPLPDEAIRWPFDPTEPLSVVLTALALPIVLLYYGLVLFMPAGTTGENFYEPVRVLGVAGEYERRAHETLAFLPAPVHRVLAGDPETVAANAEREWTKLLEEARANPEIYVDPDEVEVGRDVVLAGWGDEAATARLLAADPDVVDRLPFELWEAAWELRNDSIARTPAPAARLLVTMLVVQATVMLTGLALLIAWLVRGRRRVAFRERRALRGFGLGRGIAVYSWGQALMFLGTLVLLAATWIVPPAEDYLWYTMTWCGLPGVILAGWLLARPRGETIVGACGVSRRAGWLVPAVIAILAIDWIFEMSVGVTSVALGRTSPLHMSFDETMLFGNAALQALAALELCVAAPIVEEVLFRGVLYGAFRARMAALPAALLSGALFGLVHGYDVAGLAVVSFSGVLYALVYEHTRSLAPCILVHGLSNANVYMMVTTIRMAT